MHINPIRLEWCKFYLKKKLLKIFKSEEKQNKFLVATKDFFEGSISFPMGTMQNSSLMGLNVTRNFDSPVISRFEAGYTIEQTNIQFEQEATLNGFRFDFCWKLPLSILNKLKKLALKR